MNILPGVLYINFTHSAKPIADYRVIEEILKEYEFVKSGTQTKQFNICNGLVYSAVQILCLRGDIKADKIKFMEEGKEVETVIFELGNMNHKLVKPGRASFDILDDFERELKSYIG